ncbi:unnamed protein product [Parascedosporium putredinis]|uniref:Uncharacterized protein n=1 Tax=Parascedosporium putredinis TaxID=1442378 RepID=A0A9P1H4Z4_9PEZI|nr:unnamed protein product [Parascedosporium putredinis]CAI7995947.1 unnamed protein product [Parascedosporium putredinis]
MSPPAASNPAQSTTSISTHLADPSLTPLLTTARSQPQLEALTSLTSTALTAHSTALRLGLGTPERLMVEYPGGGPSSSIPSSNPLPAKPHRAPGQRDRCPRKPRHRRRLPGCRGKGGPAAAAPLALGEASDDDDDVGEAEDPPMLIAVVVGSGPDEGREAQRAAARLERLGRSLQREWAAEEMADRNE